MKQLFSLIFTLIALVLVGCEKPSYGTTPDTTIATLGTPEDSEIWFTTTDGKRLISLDETAFDATIVEVIYTEGGVNVIRFDKAVTEIGEGAFDNCFNIFNLSLPNSITKIGEEAFMGCTNMECLTLGIGLCNCGSNAFEGCYNLHSLHIPSIQDWCKITFETNWANPLYYAESFIINGKRISNLNIPEGITQINKYAFIYNQHIKSVFISKSVNRIEEDAFEGCDNLSKVEIENLSTWCGIDFEGELANPLCIAEKLYKEGVELRNVLLVGVPSVSEYAFMNCTSIVSLEADNSLLSVGKEAFRNCANLTTVKFDRALKDIQAQAFFNCEKLESVTCRATTPPTLEGSSTFGRNAEGRKIYVPSASLEAYKNDWNIWAEAITAIE